jgi:hypothetical protein
MESDPSQPRMQHKRGHGAKLLRLTAEARRSLEWGSMRPRTSPTAESQSAGGSHFFLVGCGCSRRFVGLGVGQDTSAGGEAGERHWASAGCPQRWRVSPRRAGCPRRLGLTPAKGRWGGGDWIVMMLTTWAGVVAPFWTHAWQIRLEARGLRACSRRRGGLAAQPDMALPNSAGEPSRSPPKPA